MADAANPFEAVQAMMLENFQKMQTVTQRKNANRDAKLHRHG
jgi:hypothetical protein